MMLDIVWVLAGLAMVVFGADVLVGGASSLARRFGVSEFVIGLTIVGFGTSLPELVVSVTGAIEGNSSVAIGNVLGSNIINTIFILALSALFMPVAISRTNKVRDIPVTILATLLVLALGLSSTLFGLGDADGLSRVEALLLLLLFVAYIILCFKASPDASGDSSGGKEHGTWTSVLLVLAGLALLIVGGRIFVNSAVNIAHGMGVSDKFIAVTILALGTSLPELATSIVAISRKRSQMALGNILGSNVFNLLLILGVSALISPMSFASVNLVDAAALALSIILVWAGVWTGKKNMLDRFDAAVMLLVFVAYMVWLFIKL